MRLPVFLKKSCLICSVGIPDALRLCLPCEKVLNVSALGSSCLVCGITLPETATCGACLQKRPYFDETHVLWAYEDLPSHLIQRLKFHHDFALIPFFAEKLREHIQKSYQDRSLPEVLLPVPLHFRRLFRRGFNQAGEVGKALARQLPLHYNDRLLQKVKATKTQVSLPLTDRGRNLKAAFRLSQKSSYQSVALLDDVVTTSATVNEIARILKRNGVREVHIWALARTMKLS